MIEPLEFPMETNNQMRDELLKNKINEVVAKLNGENEQSVVTVKMNDSLPDGGLAVVLTDAQCAHLNTRTLKNGRKFCDDCRKLIKG